jgi:hypothetical protein
MSADIPKYGDSITPEQRKVAREFAAVWAATEDYTIDLAEQELQDNIDEKVQALYDILRDEDVQRVVKIFVTNGESAGIYVADDSEPKRTITENLPYITSSTRRSIRNGIVDAEEESIENHIYVKSPSLGGRVKYAEARSLGSTNRESRTSKEDFFVGKDGSLYGRRIIDRSTTAIAWKHDYITGAHTRMWQNTLDRQDTLVPVELSTPDDFMSFLQRGRGITREEGSVDRVTKSYEPAEEDGVMKWLNNGIQKHIEEQLDCDVKYGVLKEDDCKEMKNILKEKFSALN